MSPTCEILIELPKSSQPHCTNRPLIAMVTLLLHESVTLSKFHVGFYANSKLTCHTKSESKEVESARSCYDILHGGPASFNKGTYKYEITFLFPENNLLVPSQQLHLPDGSIFKFSYSLRSFCVTLKGQESLAVRSLDIKPSLRGLRLFTDFVTTTEIEPRLVRELDVFLRQFVMHSGRNTSEYLSGKIPFRLEYVYKRRYPDKNYGDTNNVFYQNENLADFIEIYLYTPFSHVGLMKVFHEASWLARKRTTPQVRILLEGVSLKNALVKNMDYSKKCVVVQHLLDEPSQMAVRLEDFEEIDRTYAWGGLRPRSLLTDKEYRFKIPLLLLSCPLTTDTQSFYDELLSLHVSIKLQLGISFLPTLPDKNIELESRILLLPQDPTRKEELRRARASRIVVFKKPEKLPSYLESGRHEMRVWGQVTQDF